jgi:glycosyltransferase involved in cell wall biosynthesis
MAPRILHIWNTAGVGSVIAKFVDRLYGTQSLVVTRAAADAFGLTTHGRAYRDGPIVFMLRSVLMSRGYDVAHVHSLDRIVPWLKALYPSKPVVMHYHGTDILGRWGEKESRWRRADVIAFSTPNLREGAPDRALHRPNPVDTDIFFPRGGARVKGSALSIRYGADELALSKAKEMSLNLTLIDRGSVRHADMPDLLSRFEYYLDFRRPPGFDEPVRSLGKAALEALACGCKAVDWSGTVYEALPEEHAPERVAARWHETYARLLDAKRPE